MPAAGAGPAQAAALAALTNPIAAPAATAPPTGQPYQPGRAQPPGRGPTQRVPPPCQPGRTPGPTTIRLR
ncbi:putative membrane protein [Bradyrhizobium elkanii]|nr:putative membrane protein [Bradyrhizobium elkanii]